VLEGEGCLVFGDELVDLTTRMEKAKSEQRTKSSTDLPT
jgi:hypothetical protein